MAVTRPPSTAPLSLLAHMRRRPSRRLPPRLLPASPRSPARPPASTPLSRPRQLFAARPLLWSIQSRWSSLPAATLARRRPSLLLSLKRFSSAHMSTPAQRRLSRAQTLSLLQRPALRLQLLLGHRPQRQLLQRLHLQHPRRLLLSHTHSLPLPRLHHLAAPAAVSPPMATSGPSPTLHTPPLASARLPNKS